MQLMPDTADVRASDQDRERAIREIRDHFAEGRLTESELGDRIQAAYAARTVGELQALRSDLPLLPATRAEQKAEIAERRAHLQRRLLQQSGGSLSVFAVCTVIWVAGGASGMFWPIWILLVTLIPLLRNGWRLYGPSPELDAVEQELARRDHAARHQERAERRDQRRTNRRR